MKAVTRLLFVVLCFNLFGYSAAAAQPYERYVRPFYDRYALHFDQQGLKYAAPSYGIADFSAPGAPRDLLMTSFVYRFRAADDDRQALQKLHQAAQQTADFFQAEPSGQSFAYSQGAFLLVRYLVEFPAQFSSEQREQILSRFSTLLPGATALEDTENRAVIRATNWTYVLRYLRQADRITQQQFAEYSEKFQNMLNQAVGDTVTRDGWYREGKNFTPHYHAVTAFHLLWYGQMTNQPAYVNLAKRMYQNLKRISFQNGLIEAQLGHRPPGLGAQFYLMLGTIGSVVDDPDAGVYLGYASGSRFFSDRHFPNRLEFHRTAARLTPQFHDDVAFPHVAEAGRVMPGLKGFQLAYRFQRPAGQWEDADFRITNTGRIITVTDKVRNVQQKFVLGLNGSATWRLR